MYPPLAAGSYSWTQPLCLFHRIVCQSPVAVYIYYLHCTYAECRPLLCCIALHSIVTKSTRTPSIVLLRSPLAAVMIPSELNNLHVQALLVLQRCAILLLVRVYWVRSGGGDCCCRSQWSVRGSDTGVMSVGVYEVCIYEVGEVLLLLQLRLFGLKIGNCYF